MSIMPWMRQITASYRKAGAIRLQGSLFDELAVIIHSARDLARFKFRQASF